MDVGVPMGVGVPLIGVGVPSMGFDYLRCGKSTLAWGDGCWSTIDGVRVP